MIPNTNHHFSRIDLKSQHLSLTIRKFELSNKMNFKKWDKEYR